MLLDLHKLSRNFGRVQALREITLRLDTGTVGLVGNNGAGKSTLLKILLGLLPASAGSGTILGCDIRHTGLKLRGRIGYMPEAAATVPLLKGVEYVALSGDLYGMPYRDARRRAHEVLNYVGLGELRYRRLDEYSLGNLQRLKLAAALVHDPELLLLDEPTNGLDPAGRQSMLRLLQDLIAETGKSLILCTHVLKDVEKLCQQVVVLHQGTVARSGPIEEMTRSVENRFEVQWRDADSDFLHRFRGSGGSVLDQPESSATTALVSIPESWETRQLFALAAESGTVITLLREDEDDLERLFLRLTATEAARGRTDGMGIDIANYHGWRGQLRLPVRGVFSIARVALIQVLRRKSYWLLLALGLAQFIMFWSVIYAVTQLELSQDLKQNILREFGFSASTDERRDNGYMMFMERQSIVVMILLAFSGSLLVGADFRDRTLPFYLSRRIGKRHYIVGKLLAVCCLLLILTVFPALALFFEYGSFTSGWSYWLDNWRIPLGVLGYGAVLCVANSVWLVSLSAYLQRAAPIAITWCSLLLMPGRLGDFLWKASDNEYWRLLDFWRDMRLTGQLFFGKFRKDFDRDLAWWAMTLIAAITLIALLALIRRVRAVDVVE